MTTKFENKDLNKVLDPYIGKDRRIDLISELQQNDIETEGETHLVFVEDLNLVGLMIGKHISDIERFKNEVDDPEMINFRYECYPYYDIDCRNGVRVVIKSLDDLKDILNSWAKENSDYPNDGMISCSKINRPNRFSIIRDLLGGQKDDGTLKLLIFKTFIDMKISSQETIYVFGYFEESKSDLNDFKPIY